MVSKGRSVIVTYDGAIIPDNANMRRKYYGHAWIVNAKCAQDIPQSAVNGCIGFGRKKTTMSEYRFSVMADKPEHLESRERMFNIGKGEVCRKRPSTYGSHKANSTLTGMSMSMGARQGNRISNWSINIMK